tara:strand:- start:187 stop:483 length:297 start_codon:yes stop_codon:yes gene_type:complete
MNLKIEDLKNKNPLVIKEEIKKNKLVRDDGLDKTKHTLKIISMWVCFFVVILGFLTIYVIAISQHFGGFSTLTDFKWLIPYTLVVVLTAIVTYALTKK